MGCLESQVIRPWRPSTRNSKTQLNASEALGPLTLPVYMWWGCAFVMTRSSRKGFSAERARGGQRRCTFGVNDQALARALRDLLIYHRIEGLQATPPSMTNEFSSTQHTAPSAVHCQTFDNEPRVHHKHREAEKWHMLMCLQFKFRAVQSLAAMYSQFPER